jgi:DHA3 family tetracycline resistance protein-like MFS transporter
LKPLGAYRVYLTLAVLVDFLFAMIFTASAVYQVTRVGLTPLQLVLVGTTLELSVFLFEVPTGVIADVFSRRLSIIIGYFVIGLGFLVEGSFPFFAAILLAQVLWGVGYTFTSGATQAWISDEIGERAAGQAFLRGNQLGQISGLAGIIIGALLGSLRINLPIQLGGLLIMATGAFLILVMPEHGFKPTPREDRNSWQHMLYTFKEGVSVVRQRPAMMNILLIGLFYGLYSEGFDRLWTKNLLDNFTLPLSDVLQPVVWFGILRGVGVVLTAGASEIAQRRVRTDSFTSVARTLMGLTVALILALLVFAQTRWLVLAMLAYWVIYVARNLVNPLYTAWVNQRLESGVRATVISMSSQVDAIGQIAGGPVVGWIGSAFSVQAAITVSGLLLTPILPLYRRAIRQSRLPENLPDAVAASIPNSDIN